MAVFGPATLAAMHAVNLDRTIHMADWLVNVIQNLTFHWMHWLSII